MRAPLPSPLNLSFLYPSPSHPSIILYAYLMPNFPTLIREPKTYPNQALLKSSYRQSINAALAIFIISFLSLNFINLAIQDIIYSVVTTIEFIQLVFLKSYLYVSRQIVIAYLGLINTISRLLVDLVTQILVIVLLLDIRLSLIYYNRQGRYTYISLYIILVVSTQLVQRIVGRGSSDVDGSPRTITWLLQKVDILQYYSCVYFRFNQINIYIKQLQRQRQRKRRNI